MESSQNQKWVTLSYIAISALSSVILLALSLKIAGALDLETRIRSIDLYLRLGSIVLGVLVLVGLYRSGRTNQFMHEVIGELARVTWPTTKETYLATIVVMIMVVLSGLILWVLDNLWTHLVQSVI